MGFADLVAISSVDVPGSGVDYKNSPRPCNCHEAVLGWLIYSMDRGPPNDQRNVEGGVVKAWKYCRDLAHLHPRGGPENSITTEVSHSWIGVELYRGSRPLVFSKGENPPADSLRSLSAGDVVFLGKPQGLVHSVVVEKTNPGSDGPEVWVRGFNNAGTFLGSEQNQWDPTLRRLTDPEKWKTEEGREGWSFTTVQGQLVPVFYIRYASVMDNLGAAMQELFPA